MQCILTQRTSSKDSDFFLFCWLECQDFQGKWHESQITAIDEKNKDRIKIHYKGGKFGEWIDISDELNSTRIAKLHTNLLKPTEYGIREPNDIIFDLGNKCDLLNDNNKWIQSQMIDFDPIHKYVKLSFPNHNNVSARSNDNNDNININANNDDDHDDDTEDEDCLKMLNSILGVSIENGHRNDDKK